MASARDLARDLFHALLREQQGTGAKMAGNDYYTDAFHAGGPHNVGNDVLDAVAAMREAGDDVLRDARCDVTILVMRLSTAKAQYAAEHEDPDGYGSATFSEVIGKLSTQERATGPVTANPTEVQPERTQPRKRWWQFW